MQSSKCSVRQDDEELSPDKGYILFCCLFMAFTVIDKLNIIPIPEYTFLGISVLYFVGCDRRYFTPAICLMIPLSIWVSPYYIFGLAMIIFIVRFTTRIEIPVGLILLLFVMLIDLIDFVHGEFLIYEWLRMSVYYVGLAFFVFCNRERENAQRVVLSFIAGYLMVCILSLMMVIPVVGMESLVSGFRFGSGSLKDSLDPLGIKILFENELGIYSAIIFAMTLILRYRYPEGTIFYVMVSILSVIMALLAMSNTGFVLIGCAVFCYLWAIRNSASQFIVGILRLVFTGAIIYWFVNTYYSQLFEAILNRIFVDDISNGRMELLDMYFQRMFDNPKYLLCGTGSQNYVEKLQMVESCHNAFQHVFVMWGAIGLILIVATLISAWQFMSEGLEECPLLFLCSIPFLLFLIGMQAGQFDGIFPLILPTLYAIRLAE